jgi:hypothetical protein
MNDFDQVWKRIEALEGETFRQIRGGEFTYEMVGTTMKLDRTNQNLPWSQFEQAFEHIAEERPRRRQRAK